MAGFAGIRTDPRTSEAVRQRVEILQADLDPVRLLADMRAGQQALVGMADQTDAPARLATAPGHDTVPVAEFLAGLRTAWQLGEVRPTVQAKPESKRSRRRPDPLVAVTDELRAWFDSDPSQSGSDLLVRLQAVCLGRYGDGLLRTVQRRLKVWRGEIASSLVFGLQPRTPGTMIAGSEERDLQDSWRVAFPDRRRR